MRSGFRRRREQKQWADAIKGSPADLQRTTAPMWLSGAAVAKHAPNKNRAVKLLEYLVSDEARRSAPEANYEYPVKGRRRHSRSTDPPNSGGLKIDSSRSPRSSPTARGCQRNWSTRSASTTDGRMASPRMPFRYDHGSNGFRTEPEGQRSGATPGSAMAGFTRPSASPAFSRPVFRGAARLARAGRISSPPSCRLPCVIR